MCRKETEVYTGIMYITLQAKYYVAGDQLRHVQMSIVPKYVYYEHSIM